LDPSTRTIATVVSVQHSESLALDREVDDGLLYHCGFGTRTLTVIDTRRDRKVAEWKDGFRAGSEWEWSWGAINGLTVLRDLLIISDGQLLHVIPRALLARSAADAPAGGAAAAERKAVSPRGAGSTAAPVRSLKPLLPAQDQPQATAPAVAPVKPIAPRADRGGGARVFK
jgi:hypothetical protein